jgi:hypothetical protein
MVRGLGRAFVAFQVEPDTAINPKPFDRGLVQLRFFLTLATVIPLLVVISTHLWLRSAYTSHVFHLQGISQSIILGSAIFDAD